MLIAAIQPGDAPGRPRAINVPFSPGHDDHSSVTVILSLALLGFHMSVDRRSDSGIGAARFMLIKRRRCAVASPVLTRRPLAGDWRLRERRTRLGAPTFDPKAVLAHPYRKSASRRGRPSVKAP